MEEIIYTIVYTDCDYAEVSICGAYKTWEAAVAAFQREIGKAICFNALSFCKTNSKKDGIDIATMPDAYRIISFQDGKNKEIPDLEETTLTKDRFEEGLCEFNFFIGDNSYFSLRKTPLC